MPASPIPLPFVVENEFAKALFEGAVSSGAVDGFFDNVTPLADDGLETSPNTEAGRPTQTASAF